VRRHPRRLYKPGERTQICYELVDEIEKMQPNVTTRGDDSCRFAGTQAVFHAVPMPLRHFWDVPIWGAGKDARPAWQDFSWWRVGSDLDVMTIVRYSEFFRISARPDRSQFADASSRKRNVTSIISACWTTAARYGPVRHLARPADDKEQGARSCEGSCRTMPGELHPGLRAPLQPEIMPYVRSRTPCGAVARDEMGNFVRKKKLMLARSSFTPFNHVAKWTTLYEHMRMSRLVTHGIGTLVPF